MNNVYSFTYESGYDEVTSSYPLQIDARKRITVDECSPWPVVLREFTNFLSGIYGYDISEQVFVKEKLGMNAGEYSTIKEYE